MGIPVKVAYRASSQFPVLFVIIENGMWSKAGLDVTMEQITSNKEAQAALLEGKVDFVFGNHVSPYHARLQGHQIIYLAQTVNWARDSLVTNPSIAGVEQLPGKEIAVGHLHGHPTYTSQLLLERWGFDLERDKITLKAVGNSEWAKLNAVLEGTCAAAFLHPPYDLLGQKKGLKLIEPPPLGMIWGVTLTTTSSVAREKPEACKAMIRSLAEGAHFIKNNKEETIKILNEKVAPLLKLEDQELMDYLYQKIASLIESKPYPTLESIENVFSLACSHFEGVKDLNPLLLWDLHFLRELDESGALEFGS